MEPDSISIEQDLDLPVLPLFTQLNVKVETEWKETSRWVKFQEDVEDEGKRWSKPFVPAIPLAAIMDVKDCLDSGIVAFDVQGYNIVDILDSIRDVQLIQEATSGNHDSSNVWQLLSKNMQSLKDMLGLETKFRMKSRFLAKVSFVMNHGDSPVLGKKMSTTNQPHVPEHVPPLRHSISEPSNEKLFMEAAAASATPAGLEMNPFMKKLPKGAEACLIMVCTTEFAPFPMLIFTRLHRPQIFRSFCEVSSPTRFVCIIVGPIGSETRVVDMGKALGTLMSDQIFPLVAYKATSKNQLTNAIDTYSKEVTVLAPSVWNPEARLDPPDTLPSVAKRHFRRRSRMSQRMRYSSANCPPQDDKEQEPINEDDEEQEGLILNSSQTQSDHDMLKQNGDTDNLYVKLERGVSRVETGGKADFLDNLDNINADDENSHGDDEALIRTGKLFGGLIADIKRKIPWFISDFKDGLHLQSLATIIYIYLATVTKAITFGGFLSDITDKQQGVLEAFLGHALAGGVFCLLGGQPLTVLGCTGPVLIFEKILVDFCAAQDLDYMTLRLWIGLWTCFFCILVVAFDLSSFVRYFTRFTEESFAALVGFIFIYESLKKLYKLSDKYKVHEGFHLSQIGFVEEYCHCNPASESVANEKYNQANETHRKEFDDVLLRTNFSMHDYHDIDWNHLTLDECKMFGGVLEGEWCNYVPDIFFFSVTLFFGTFMCASTLKSFKTSRYFPNFVRTLIADYAVILSILLFVVVDHHFNLETPKLIVPTVFEPTRSDLRGWIIPFTKENIPWYLYPLSGIPALFLTILIFMDQQITSVIVNRKEHKLRKGCGYHLDMLIVGIMMGVSSILGLPWCVAATVLCLGHVDSLKMETETSAPGEKPTFLGVREQRVTGTMVFILTGLSVKLAPALAFIPMPVLYGVLLYMGVSSLKGMQFIDRLGLIFMPPKYQPDYSFLRHVPIMKVHLFTFVQALTLAILWLLKSTQASLLFPLMVLAMVGFRKSMDYFPRIFSQRDLFFLDNLMPSSSSEKKNEDDGSDENLQKKSKPFFTIPKFWKVDGNEMNEVNSAEPTLFKKTDTSS